MSDASIDDGCTLTQNLLQLSQIPTAIFAAGDNLALGALRALYEAHLRVPDDMSVISYDDTFVANLYPPLTSVGQPLSEIADHAVALIVEHVGRSGAEHLAASHLTFPAHLHIRGSTGVPPCGSQARPAHAATGGETQFS